MSSVRAAAAALAFAGVAAAVGAGCGGGSGGPAMHPVSGRVEHPGGDVSALAGCIIDARHETEQGVHASGEIQSDGRFTLETLHAGVIRKGAMEGRYKVRIVPPDDDKDARKKVNKVLAPIALK
jgi:hypothetical protein